MTGVRERGASWALRLFVLNGALLVCWHLLCFELLAWAEGALDPRRAPSTLAVYLGAVGLLAGLAAALFAGMVVDRRRPGLVVWGAFTSVFFIPGALAGALTSVLGMGAVLAFIGPVLLLPVVEAALIWGRRGPGAWLLVALHLGGLALLYLGGTEVDFNAMDGASVRLFYVVVDVVLCLMWSLAPLLRPPPSVDAFWD